MTDTECYRLSLAEWRKLNPHVREVDVSMANRSAILRRAQQIKDEQEVTPAWFTR